MPRVHTAPGHSQKKEISPGAAVCFSQSNYKIKSVKLASCVTPLSCVKSVVNVRNAVTHPSVGARLQKFWQVWWNLGASPKIVQTLKEGYTLPFQNRPLLSRHPTVISRYVNRHRNSYLSEALHQLISKNAVEQVQNPTSLGFFNRLFLVPKPNNKWRSILDLSKLNLFLRVEKFKMETPETIRTSLQQGEWVTSIDFKDAYFHIPIQVQSRKFLRFQAKGQTYQFKALPFGLSTAPLEFTVVAKEVKLVAIHKGIRIHQYLDDWLVRAKSHQVCLQHTRDLLKLCQDLGWIVNLEKSELEPKQVFDFVGYQFDLKLGRVRPTPERWQNLKAKIQALLARSSCPVRQFMSLIGLLTATEKQVYLGRLHMRPIQWHLKNNWRVSLEKVIPIPTSLHPHLEWWLEEDNVLQGQPLHPLKHALQIFTDASKEGFGTHLDEHTTKSVWSLPESKLHINYLELKAVLLALRDFQQQVANQIVLVATDNTTVVSYINNEGGMRSGPLCALLWRILTWCTVNQVTLKARHIPGQLNVVADKLSRLGQIIQTEWSLLTEVFQTICIRWHRPQIDLFATKFNNKLPQFVSLVPDSLATAVDALSLPWEDLDAYVFPPVAILGKVVEKLLDSPGNRIILIAPGWPNMPWFWDLVDMSSQIPLSLPNLPNLLTQPFNQTPHRNLSGLNLHAWLLEPQQSNSRASLRQWRQELRLLIEDPPDQSMRQSGPFLKWCLTNKVDFGAPPVTSVADFLMYLFQDRKLQPSTIDGYRSTIADKLGNSSLNISKDEILTRLLDSFHRDRPKGRRGIPSWNLSLVLHQLTKAPFEPLREASLKLLTFKTVFLLALGSGKRRSEIHAWQNRNIRHQSDWSKVSLYPSPSFLSKNQLAKEGPESVAPVVIPALAPTLDKSLKSDRSLCPVRALRYYLDRTSDRIGS